MNPAATGSVAVTLSTTALTPLVGTPPTPAAVNVVVDAGWRAPLAPPSPVRVSTIRAGGSGVNFAPAMAGAGGGNAPATVMVNSRLLVSPSLSVTVAVKVKVPTVVGSPVIGAVRGQRQSGRQRAAGDRPGDRLTESYRLQRRRVRGADAPVGEVGVGGDARRLGDPVEVGDPSIEPVAHQRRGGRGLVGEHTDPGTRRRNSGALRSIWLFSIVTPVLVSTSMPTSVPTPPTMLSLITTLSASINRIAVDVGAGCTEAAADDRVVGERAARAAECVLNRVLRRSVPGGSSSGGPNVLPDTFTVTGPMAISPLFWNPVATTFVTSTVWATVELDDECPTRMAAVVMGDVAHGHARHRAARARRRTPHRADGTSVANRCRCTIRFARCIDCAGVRHHRALEAAQPAGRGR